MLKCYLNLRRFTGLIDVGHFDCIELKVGERILVFTDTRIEHATVQVAVDLDEMDSIRNWLKQIQKSNR